MNPRIDRRNVVKTAAAAAGLLLLGGSASADPPREAGTLTGEWFKDGKLDQPCAIVQLGRVLLLINEKGDIATAHMVEADQFTVLRGWGEDVTGRIGDRGRVIAWKAGGYWKRR